MRSDVIYRCFLVLFILLSRFFLNYSYYRKTTPYRGVPFVLFSIKKCIIIISLVSRKQLQSGIKECTRKNGIVCVCNVRETRYKQRFQSGLRAHFELSKIGRTPVFEKGRYS